MRNVLDHDVSLRYNNMGAKGKLAFQDNAGRVIQSATVNIKNTVTLFVKVTV